MLKYVEKIFTVAMLFYAAGAILPQIIGASSGLSRAEGNPLALAVQMALYSVAFCFIALDWPRFLDGARRARWVVALSLIAAASAAWSQDPVFTLRRSAVLFATTAFGVYFGSRYSISEQLRLLAWTCALIVLTSFGLGLFLPDYGVDHLLHPGDWRGVFIHKNVLARVMLLSVLVFHFVRPTIFGKLRWVGIAACLGLLALSRSVTGVVVFALLLATLPLWRLVRSNLTIIIPAGIVIGFVTVGAAVLVAMHGRELLDVLHRSPTLTGRTDLWPAVLVSIGKRPWLGYGFNAFWMGMQGESASVITRLGWAPAHAHNGFFDLLLDLGILGLGTFLAGYLSLWNKSLRLLRSATGPYPVWLCVYLVFMFVYNLAESSILVQNNLFWILYVSAASTLAALFPEEYLSAKVVSQT
jgi:O-antigen ligase